MKIVAVSFALLAACASDPAQEGAGSGSDQSSPPIPGGSASCGMNEHACADSCVANQTNDPNVGCAMGCGGACTSPANGSSTCTESGTCGVTCNSGYSLVGEQCIADSCQQVGYSCGTYATSSDSVDCGTCLDSAVCGADHTCQIARDAKEPNDTLSAATQLGDYNDADDREDTTRSLTIDSASDEDWFTFHVTDGLDFGNPDAYVDVSHSTLLGDWDVGWLESPHELTLWFKCDGADNGSTVECGEWYTTYDTNSLNDPELGVGCTIDATYVIWAHVAASCATTSENGTVTVRVRKTDVPMGDTYDLTVKVE